MKQGNVLEGLLERTVTDGCLKLLTEKIKILERKVWKKILRQDRFITTF